MQYIAILAVCSVILSIIAVNMFLTRPTPLGAVYEGYNHIRIYEDGSYIAETKQGQAEWGCINGAICND